MQASKTSPESLRQIKPVLEAWRTQRIQIFPDENFVPDGIETSNYSVHATTGVKAAHDMGIYGKGTIVAVVDSGVDYNHPAVRFLLEGP